MCVCVFGFGCVVCLFEIGGACLCVWLCACVCVFAVDGCCARVWLCVVVVVPVRVCDGSLLLYVLLSLLLLLCVRVCVRV